MEPKSSFFGFIKGFITNANVRGVKKGLIVSPSNYSKQVLSCMTVVLHTILCTRSSLCNAIHCIARDLLTWNFLKNKNYYKKLLEFETIRHAL